MECLRFFNYKIEPFSGILIFIVSWFWQYSRCFSNISFFEKLLRHIKRKNFMIMFWSLTWKKFWQIVDKNIMLVFEKQKTHSCFSVQHWFSTERCFGFCNQERSQQSQDCFSQICLSFNSIGNSIPSKLSNSACSLKYFVIRSAWLVIGFNFLATHHL